MTQKKALYELSKPTKTLMVGNNIEYAQVKGSLNRRLRRSLYSVLGLVDSPWKLLRRHIYTAMGRVDFQAHLKA